MNTQGRIAIALREKLAEQLGWEWDATPAEGIPSSDELLIDMAAELAQAVTSIPGITVLNLAEPYRALLARADDRRN